MKFAILLLSFVVGIFYYTPTTYYVTPAGSGTGTGLDSNNTLSYAALFPKSLASGDIVKFKAGFTYNGPNYTKDGVLYDRYSSGSNPVLSGFTTLSTWTPSGTANIYYASLSTVPRGVSIDGQLKALGRYPNSGYLTYSSHSGNSSITDATVASLPNSFVGGEVVIKKYRYIIDRHVITGRSGNTLSFSSTNFYGSSSSYEPTDGNGYFIQNHLAALDLDGEWTHDTSTNRLYVYFGDNNPSGHVVKASTTSTVLICNSTVGATFQNIDLEGGNFGMYSNGTSNITFNNVNIKQCGFGIYSDASNNITVNGGTVNDCWTGGIILDGGTYNSTITGVKLNNTATIPGMGASGENMYNGIGIYGLKATVTNCEVTKTGFNAIGLIGDSMLVENNFVDSFCMVKDDGGGLYHYTTYPQIMNSIIFRGNIVTNAIGAPAGGGSNGDPKGEAAGIYLDGYSNHSHIINNGVFQGVWVGILVNANSDHIITGNTIFDWSAQIAINQVATSGNGVTRNLVIKRNEFTAKDSTQLSMLVSMINVADNPINFGVMDSNYYSRPIDNTQTIMMNRSYSGGSVSTISLATWKSTTGQDVHSLSSPLSVSSPSQLIYKYNIGTTAANFPTGAIYSNVENTITYPGLIYLYPYSGDVLLYQSAIIPPASNKYTIRLRQVQIKPTP